MLTLSPSTHASPEVQRETTPKLPRRERLASLSRLSRSGHFAKKVSPEDNPEVNPDRESPIISRCSPCRQNLDENFSPRKNNYPNWKDYLKPGNLPFSPKFRNTSSPIILSPNYKQPTPTKSPLYTPERKTCFLGRGSFGNVTLCDYKGYKFALKVNHQCSSNSIGEANLLHIRHPHLVRVLYITKILGRHFICMEFAGYCNLQQILDTKSELDFHRRLSFCRQTASGLRHLHDCHIIHGDVKPANVVVSSYGICKLGDFGHCIKLDGCKTSSRLRTEDIVGTAAYAAPEILRGSPITIASDVYSFGILLWQVQSREIPFAEEHPHVVIYNVVRYGKRPFFKETEEVVVAEYSKIMKYCWDENPRKRPLMMEVCTRLQNLNDSSND